MPNPWDACFCLRLCCRIAAARADASTVQHMPSVQLQWSQALLLLQDSFFKHEQEADVQELRNKLIADGKFQHLLQGGDPDAHASAPSGDAVSPVLMEVLQASARISVPDAARRRVWELCEPGALLWPCVVDVTSRTVLDVHGCCCASVQP
jgi:hypothetical protein